MKRIIEIYIQAFKYSRRLSRLNKALRLLLKEIDCLDKVNITDREFLLKSIEDIYKYTHDLLDKMKLLKEY